MARFFVARENIHEGRGVIDGSELNHLRKALRLTAGDRITVFDGAGQEHEAIIARVSPESCEFDVVRSWAAGSESPLRMILAVGLTKGEKMDFVVEKATELGAHVIVPFVSDFAVPRWDEKKVAAHMARWRKIAHAAVKQCGRSAFPEISPPREFYALVTADWSPGLKLLFWEKGGGSLDRIQRARPDVQTVVVAIGPEGGFSEPEAALAQSHGFEPIHFGRRILRAETAAVAALSLVQYLWGDAQDDPHEALSNLPASEKP